MSVITNKWNDESGDSINIESPSFQIRLLKFHHLFKRVLLKEV